MGFQLQSYLYKDISQKRITTIRKLLYKWATEKITDISWYNLNICEFIDSINLPYPVVSKPSSALNIQLLFLYIIHQNISEPLMKRFCIIHFDVRGDTHMTSTLRGGERGAGLRQKWDVIGRKGWGDGGSECSGRPIFIFLIKEKWFCAMTRHHAESNINVLLTINLPIDSGVRQ